MEEINDKTVGRWNAKLKSYVVHVDNVRSNDRTAAMNEDHRWLHLDIFATFYTYTPEEGQQLKGEIKKVGNRAAICLVFDVFTATVFANDDTELSTWNAGDELQFEVLSFTHRRKGPIIRARSSGKRSRKSNANKRKIFDLEEEDAIPMEEEPQPEVLLDNGHDLDDETGGLLESSKSKKKKRKKMHDPESFEGADESGIVNSQWQNEETAEEYPNEQDKTLDLESEISKKKKKKKKKSSYNEDD